MISLLTCDGYRTIDTAPSDADAPALCRALEEARNDGWAVVAWRDGSIVADADGWCEAAPMSAYERAEASFGEQP